MIPDNTAVIAIMLLVAFAMTACSSNVVVEQKAKVKNIPTEIYKNRSPR